MGTTIAPVQPETATGAAKDLVLMLASTRRTR
jgi:hypothetical protein